MAPGRTLVTLGLSGLCSCQGSLASSRTAQCGRMLGEIVQLIIQKKCSETKSNGVTPKIVLQVCCGAARAGETQTLYRNRGGEEQGAHPPLGRWMDTNHGLN